MEKFPNFMFQKGSFTSQFFENMNQCAKAQEESFSRKRNLKLGHTTN